MKILVVCGAGRTFGRERVTLSLMEGLRERGHEVKCLTSNWTDGSFEKEIERLSIESTSLPLGFISKTMSISAFRMTLGQLIRLPLLWVGYRQALREFGPDVVVHSAIHHTFLLWPVFGREKNIFHVHDNFLPTRFYRSLFAMLRKRIDCFVAVSNFIAAGLGALGIEEKKIKTVLNGIAPAGGEIDSLDAQLSLPNGSGIIRLGIVGQVAPWKGHSVLIEALNILKKKQLPFVCRIYGQGDPEFQSLLQAKIKEYDLNETVEWQGFISNMSEIYRNLDICVVPSLVPESFGLVAAESASFGVPVVASRAGGLPEIVLEGKTGCLVETGSPDQLAEKIYALSHSSATRCKMADCAIKLVSEALSTKRMVAEMENVFLCLQTTNLPLEPVQTIPKRA